MGVRHHLWIFDHMNSDLVKEGLQYHHTPPLFQKTMCKNVDQCKKIHIQGIFDRNPEIHKGNTIKKHVHNMLGALENYVDMMGWVGGRGKVNNMLISIKVIKFL